MRRVQEQSPCGCQERRAGYTGEEMRAKAADGTLLGVSKWELDTPALCVDLDTLERNIATMKARLASTGVATRPHAKTHKCPAIAKLQLATGSIGVCTAKVSEAEVLFANGVEPILMTTSNVTANEDPPRDADSQDQPAFRPGRRLSGERARPLDAAREAGVVADVVVDVAVGTRTGVPAGAQALALAQLVD